MQRSTKRKEADFQLCSTYINSVKNCKSLPGLLDLHKIIWDAGLRTNGLGPDLHGMFRCSDISQMTSRDVYLGNVYGLFTLNLNQWEGKRFDDSSSYDIVLNQYKRHLLSNLHEFRSSIYDNGIRRDRLVEFLKESIGVSRVNILSKGLTPGKVHDISFLFGGKEISSKLLWLRDGKRNNFLVPLGVLKGENPATGRQARDTVWKDIHGGKQFMLKHSFFKGLSLEPVTNTKGLRIK